MIFNNYDSKTILLLGVSGYFHTFLSVSIKQSSDCYYVIQSSHILSYAYQVTYYFVINYFAVLFFIYFAMQHYRDF